MSKSKNDIHWEKIFDKYKIIETVLRDGHFNITATDINEFREARLMTKFDHKSQLPKLFVDNNLSILPTSRGSYIIGSFDTFHDFNKNDIEISKITFPHFLESLDYGDITSEATAINCAFVTSILTDFTGEERLYPTVSGRMSSSSFDFKINSKNGLSLISVGNSQIEIDGGYEGDNSLNLIEAKNYISDDFLVRQLYYPYKLWKNKVSKKVRSIFLTYTNGVFHLREYLFDDINHYNSLRLIKEKKYAIHQNGTINIEVIQRILEKVKSVKELNIPFPQGDVFERVINLCELLNQKGSISKEDITQNYDFHARQTDYYSNAGKYLGLIENRKENKQVVCFLTEKGQRLFSLSLIERQLEFITLIVSHSAFKNTLRLYLQNGVMPTRNQIIEIMKHSNLYNINTDVTYGRRASTITGWLNWILNQVED